MTALTDLTDVIITDPQVGDRLVYESGFWVNQSTGDGAPWVRNPSWLTLTPVSDTAQIFRGLFGVYPNGLAPTALAVLCRGNYTVDWGDGSTPTTHTDNTQAEYIYDYDNVALAGTNAPVTLTDAGDLVGRTAHGYVNGDQVTLFEVVGSTGPVSGTMYFVVNATADTFQISLTEGGSPVAITGDGAAALLPYKQVIVTITPTGAANLTVLNLQRRYGTRTQTYSVPWLDIEVSMPNASTATDAITIANPFSLRLPLLERVRIANRGSFNTFSTYFSGLTRLQKVELPSTMGTATSFSSMFNGCTALQEAPMFNTANATTFQSMFQDCRNLRKVPLYNTANATTLQNMFQDCRNLVQVPLFDTANATTLQNMFQNCSSLEEVPLFNTVKVTSMSGMFNGCASLRTIPPFNTPVLTFCNSMFNGCSALESVPLFNTSSVTGGPSSMFNACASLTNVPPFNFSSVSGSVSNMFNGCTSLVETPPLNFSAGVSDITSMFIGCRALTSIGFFNTSGVTNTFLPFTDCISLREIPAFNFSGPTSAGFLSNLAPSLGSLERFRPTGIRWTFSLASGSLSAAALDEVFTNLARVTTQQTITVTGNYGAALVTKASSGTTSGSTTVTISNTSGIVAGMEVSGTGISDAVAVTFQDTGDTVTRTAHGIADGTPVSFASITTTTGIIVWQPYFVVNATADTFQVADTVGGAPRALTSDGSGTLIYGTTVVSIVPNTSVTLSIPASATGSVTLLFGSARRSIARLKNWAVTG
jgi:surface protein